MFSRIHRQFGTAGLVVAIVALIAAMAGGAWAAQSGLNGKQKKEVKKIAKQFAGKQGPQGVPGAKGDPGAPGAAGAAGEKGAKGDQGIQGIQGIPGTAGDDGKSVEVELFDKDTEPVGDPCDDFGGAAVKVEGSTEIAPVCNGETGFTDTLPEGKTETGAWSGVISPAGFAFIPVSFTIPLAVDPTVHIAPDPNCPGGVSDPKAAPGHFCLYVNEVTGAPPTLTKPTMVNGLSRVGGFIELTGASEDYGVGSWAVTGGPPIP